MSPGSVERNGVGTNIVPAQETFQADTRITSPKPDRWIEVKWSFVFTNVLTDDKPSERRAVDELLGLAERTGRAYLPVVLQCEHDALMERVANSDRRDRSKWTDRSGVGEFFRTHRLVDVIDLAPLTIDTNAMEPTQAVSLILQRLDNGT